MPLFSDVLVLLLFHYGFWKPVFSDFVVLFFSKAYKKYEILTRKREAEIQHEKETKLLESLDEQMTPETEPEIQDELPITLPDTVDPPYTAPPPIEVAKPKKPENSQKKERKDAPVLSKEKVEDWEKVSDIYNGAEMENYKWSQTITDIDVRVSVPEGTTAKDVKVDIRSDHLKVRLSRPTQQVSLSCVLNFSFPVNDKFSNLLHVTNWKSSGTYFV